MNTVTVALEELVEDRSISYGVVQPGSDGEGGVPIVRVGDLESGSLAAITPQMRVAPAIEAKFERTRLRGGEVLVSLVGTAGRAATVPTSLAGWNVARAVGVLRPKGVEPAWLVYALRSPLCQDQISASLNTTVQATLNLSDLKKVRIPMPTQGVRRAIAEVLGALDDKIAANDKLAGAADSLVRAVLGRTGGAGRVVLGDLFSNPRVAAKPPIKADSYVGLEHLPRRLMWLGQSGDADGLLSGKFWFSSDDVLFGKLRPYFHKVVVSDRQGVCSTDILVLRPLRPELRGYCWAAASSDAVVERVSAMSAGTRMPRTNWSDLAGCEVEWPGETAALELSERVVAIRDRVAAALAESRYLAELRDTLLPHLMSGRITVRDAEQQVEGVL